MEKLYANEYYHIYNRGNGGENLFYREENYRYFLRKYHTCLADYIDTYAFCLMPNHFHFLVKVKDLSTDSDEEEMTSFGKMSSLVSEQFRKLFIGYTMAINKQQNRHGNLFDRPFKRKHIDNHAYLQQLVYYIHNNPVHHGFVDYISEWEYSSYHWILSDQKTTLKRVEVLDWFDGSDGYLDFHRLSMDFDGLGNFILED